MDKPIAATLREYAAAIDKDRGHDKSAVTRTMREAADEIDRMRAVEAAALALADIKLAGDSEPFWLAFLALREALGLEEAVVVVG